MRNEKLERLELVNLPKGTKAKLKKLAGKRSLNSFVGEILINKTKK